MESCPIKSTQRQRVLSSHGPRRTEVTECISVDNNVTPKFIDAIKNITNTKIKTYNTFFGNEITEILSKSPSHLYLHYTKISLTTKIP